MLSAFHFSRYITFSYIKTKNRIRQGVAGECAKIHKNFFPPCVFVGAMVKINILTS